MKIGTPKEVFEGERTAESALEYLRVDPESELGQLAAHYMELGEPPF